MPCICVSISENKLKFLIENRRRLMSSNTLFCRNYIVTRFIEYFDDFIWPIRSINANYFCKRDREFFIYTDILVFYVYNYAELLSILTITKQGAKTAICRFSYNIAQSMLFKVQLNVCIEFIWKTKRRDDAGFLDDVNEFSFWG